MGKIYQQILPQIQMANKYMKVSSASTLFKKCELKNAVTFHCQPIRKSKN